VWDGQGLKHSCSFLLVYNQNCNKPYIRGNLPSFLNYSLASPIEKELYYGYISFSHCTKQRKNEIVVDP